MNSRVINILNESVRLKSMAVIILTYNEEANIPQALSSISGWANEIFILDSHSTDHTLNIALQYSCHIKKHKFENYAKQRNFALENFPLKE